MRACSCGRGLRQDLRDGGKLAEQCADHDDMGTHLYGTFARQCGQLVSQGCRQVVIEWSSSDHRRCIDNQATVRRQVLDLVETEPPVVLPPNEIVICSSTTASTDLGTTFMDVLRRDATALAAADSRLVLASVSDRFQGQLRVAGLAEVVDAGDVYLGARVGATLRRAYDDARAWFASRR